MARALNLLIVLIGVGWPIWALCSDWLEISNEKRDAHRREMDEQFKEWLKENKK